MSVPALPVANFVVVQPALALGGLEGRLDLPELPGNLHQRLQSGLGGGCMEPVLSALRLIFDATPLLQPLTQFAVVAIDFIGSYPATSYARLQRTLDHAPR